MRAIVLVGGEGTRLRPLTETIPKPLLPLVDRPSLDHVLDHLARHDVHEVVLSSSYLEETFRSFIDGRRGDPRITWITEPVLLGTGGAVVNALGHVDGTFLVLNGDILTDLDLSEMVAQHRDRKASATIALTHVDDARPFGLVPTDADGRVREFREKPADPVPGHVNAGTYVLEPDALDGWPSGEPASIERQVFPALIESGRPVLGFRSEAYWLDLGTPETYLRAQFDILEGMVGGGGYPAPFVAGTARVDLRAHLGRWVVVGEGAVVAEDAQIDDSVLLEGAIVGAGARMTGSILGPRSDVGPRATVTGSVLAEGARVPRAAVLNGAKVSAGQLAVPSA